MQKKFLVPGEIPLAALAPARRAAAASEPKAPPCPLTVRAHHGTAMLAEIYLLKLEAAVRHLPPAAKAHPLGFRTIQVRPKDLPRGWW